MNILADAHATSQCPTFCDPALCDADQHVDVRHTSTPRILRLTDDDVEVAINVVRDDDRSLDGHIHQQRHGVLLAMKNLESVLPSGAPIEAYAYLRPEEAERIALYLLDSAGIARTAAREVSR